MAGVSTYQMLDYTAGLKNYEVRGLSIHLASLLNRHTEITFSIYK